MPPSDSALASELRAVLDDELGRLPERLRTAILLCELEGLSRRAAAARLGIAEGTLSSRLARAKSRLRDRLARKGFAPAAAATLSACLTRDAQATLLPPLLVDSTIRAAMRVAAGSALAGVASTSVATLTEGVLKAMLLAKLKLPALGLITAAVVSTSVGVVAQTGPERISDNDRLKVVEQKLDRLLEMFGARSQQSAAPDWARIQLPRPPRAVALPSASPAPAPEPRPNAPLPSGTPLPPGAPPTPLSSRPMSPSIAAGQTGNFRQLSRGMPGPLPAPRTSRADLADRVDHLERRLSELERRFSELDRRVNTRPQSVDPPYAPAPLSSLAPTPPARMNHPYNLETRPEPTLNRVAPSAPTQPQNPPPAPPDAPALVPLDSDPPDAPALVPLDSDTVVRPD